MARIIKFKEVNLYPTPLLVDIWVGGYKDTISELFHKRYGADASYYRDTLTPNQVGWIVSTKDSHLKGARRLVLNVETFDTAILIHELNHVVYYLIEYCGLEFSQEWISYTLEYLYNQCKDKNSYYIYK